MAANPLKKTEIRRYMTEVPAFRPFFQRYGWTLCKSLNEFQFRQDPITYYGVSSPCAS